MFSSSVEKSIFFELVINREMSYSIITDPQVSPPDLDRVASEGRTKYSKLVEAVHNDWETYIKKNLKNWLLKHNQMVQVTLKEFIDYFQQ